MTIPNLLSAVRAAAVLPVIGLIALGEPAAALLVFVLAAATDVVDGALARSRHLTTALGMSLDPLADKILVIGTLGALAVQGAAPLWPVGLVLARELVAIQLRARLPRDLPATVDGKVKTVLQVAAAAALTANAAWPLAGLAGGAHGLLLAAVALTVASGVMLVFRATQTSTDAV